MNETLSPKEISDLLDKSIQHFEFPSQPELLYQPMQYILSLGGKRLRPVLALLSYNMFSDNPEDIVLPALSIELFHNFSLIHDDIMDKAPVRRGEETVHIKWNNNVGILSGDGMLVKAYELLEDIDPELLAPVLKGFNKTAIEVCEGQQYDMDFESRSLEDNPVTEDEYIEMIRLKTSVLFGFSMKLGALLAGEGSVSSEKLYDAGVHMGLAFQLQDDLLDLYGGEKFGKLAGGDIINAKKTFMLVKALKISSKEDNRALIDLLNNSEISDSSKVNRVKDIYNQYGIPDLVKSEIDIHLKNFKETVEQVGSDRSLQLIDLVLGLANRAI